MHPCFQSHPRPPPGNQLPGESRRTRPTRSRGLSPPGGRPGGREGPRLVGTGGGIGLRSGARRPAVRVRYRAPSAGDGGQRRARAARRGGRLSTPGGWRRAPSRRLAAARPSKKQEPFARRDPGAGERAEPGWGAHVCIGVRGPIRRPGLQVPGCPAARSGFLAARPAGSEPVAASTRRSVPSGSGRDSQPRK